MKNEEYDLDEAIRIYNSVGLQTRNMNYLAKWVYDVYEKLFYLPCVDSDHIKRLAIDKAKLSIFAILVDDLADNYNIRNSELLEKAIRTTSDCHKEHQNGYLEVTRKIWLDVMNSIKKYPRYNELKEMFYFDMEQFLDAIRYSSLIHNIDMDNELESKIYSYHNMMIIVYLDLDLMCSPNFKKDELKNLRPIFHYVQNICHIGNVISTYKREICERDFSCPLISIGLRRGITTKEEINLNPAIATEKLKPLEEYFKNIVKNDLKKIEESAHEIESVNLAEFSEKLKNVFEKFMRRECYWENNSSLNDRNS